jgi:acyl-CoA synthetase (AMP-forming)/AMP-acid ligase II
MSASDDRIESVAALTAAAAARFAAAPALVDGETRLTYAALADAARDFGTTLVASGIAPGEPVAIWAFNCAEWVIALLGTWAAGAVVVPVNTRWKGIEAAEILQRSRARVLVTVTDFLGVDYPAMLAATGAALPDLSTTVIARGPAAPGAETWQTFLGRATRAARAELDRRSAAVRGDDVADVLFTSGTTGRPKGVVQTHARTLRVATDWVAMTGLAAGDRYLMVNPYFHQFGLKAGILACLAAGATMLPQAVFDVDEVLARVAAERVTVLPGPPTLYHAILDHPGRARHDLSSLRVAVTGAADIPVELIRRVHDELAFSTIVTGYGLTEAGTATATAPDDDLATIATTVGRPRPGFALRIVGESGRDVPRGEPGEVLLRGPTVMSQYLDDPEATAEVLSPDGWLRTGDLGVLGEDGCLRIVGRTKDMFIVGGFKAYPAEIENVLLRHADVQQAAVIGVADARLGEVGMAFVVTRPGARSSGDAIVAWCRNEMANYKVPRIVQIVDQLPLNASGKVMKDVLRQRAASGVDPLRRPGPAKDG